MREEHRLGVFENRVLRKIFGPKREDVTGDWIKLHNEDVACVRKKRNVYKFLVGKTGGERQHGRLTS
jgi:hypothetical protein